MVGVDFLKVHSPQSSTEIIMKKSIAIIALSLFAFAAFAQSPTTVSKSDYEKFCKVVQVSEVSIEAPQKASPIDSLKSAFNPLNAVYKTLATTTFTGIATSSSTTTQSAQSVVLKCLGGANLITVVQQGAVKLKQGQDAILESYKGTIQVAAI
jgi:mannose-6-phosphate isomerase class I